MMIIYHYQRIVISTLGALHQSSKFTSKFFNLATKLLYSHLVSLFSQRYTYFPLYLMITNKVPLSSCSSTIKLAAKCGAATQLMLVTGSPFHFWVRHSAEVRLNCVKIGHMLLEWQLMKVSLFFVLFKATFYNFYLSILNEGVINTLAKCPSSIKVLQYSQIQFKLFSSFSLQSQGRERPRNLSDTKVQQRSDIVGTFACALVRLNKTFIFAIYIECFPSKIATWGAISKFLRAAKPSQFGQLSKISSKFLTGKG